MKGRFKVLIFGILLLCSCKSYSDQKIQIRSQEYIDLFSPSIDICVTGKEDVNYTFKISYNDILIDSLSISSALDKSFKKVNFSFADLKDEIPLLAYKLVMYPQVLLSLTAVNKEHKLILDTNLTLKIKLPPISSVRHVTGSNFSKTDANVLNQYEQKITSSISNGISKNIKQAAILADIISTKTHHPRITIDHSLVPILKTAEKVKIFIITDTIYKYSFIYSYPSKDNKEYTDLDLDRQIKDDITHDNIIKTDWYGKKLSNLFILESEIVVSDAGLNGLFLINIDKNGSYTYHEVGNYLIDKTAPSFYPYKNFQFTGDPRYEGLICLNYESFFGHNPYTIPFLGKVFGDISEIYVDGKRIPFQIGRELFFKKLVHLDDGYNRIPIKVVDAKGNTAEYFIPITMEISNKNQVNIDNEINIDNR